MTATPRLSIPERVGLPFGPGLPDELISALAWLHAASSRPSSAADLREWLDLVGVCQQVVNSVTAAQNAAIVRAAAIETDWAEDGTLIERHHLLGSVQLDSVDLIAAPLVVTHHTATNRLEAAVRFATPARASVDADPADVDSPVDSSDEDAAQAGAVATDRGVGVDLEVDCVGLPGGCSAGRLLHRAMLEGRLDGYRAGVVWQEVEAAPEAVSAAVVASLDPVFATEPGAGLRRRTRRALAAISPDLLRQRAVRARAESGLRRWAEEPGVDTWLGTFPSEDAAAAWVAIDELAHRYLAEGVVTVGGIARARAKALTDLVTAQATVTVRLEVTVPADTLPDQDAPEGPAPEAGSDDSATGFGCPDGPDPLADSRAIRDRTWIGRSSAAARGWRAGDLVQATLAGRPQPEFIPAGWLARQLRPDPDDPMGTRRDQAVRAVRRRRASTAEPASHAQGAPRAATVATLGPAGVTVRPCAPSTGALLDPANALDSDGYRPGTALIRLIKARDGRCRFPGCHVAARFCDLDHVLAWPTGATTADNLMCLCRRHHRIKQHPGWRVTLHHDGRSTWTDPTGRTRATDPLDRLTLVVLPETRTSTSKSAPPPADSTTTSTPPVTDSATRQPALDACNGATADGAETATHATGGRTRQGDPEHALPGTADLATQAGDDTAYDQAGPISLLEFHLDHALTTVTTPEPARDADGRRIRGRCVLDIVPARRPIRCDFNPLTCASIAPSSHASRTVEPGIPPF